MAAGVTVPVAFIIFNGLVHGYGAGPRPLLPGHPYLGYVLANTVGMAVSYRGSRSWVFKDRPPRTADGGRTAFLVINAVTMLIPIACLWTSRNALGLVDPVSDNLAANVVGLFLGLVARFYLFRTYVFRRPVHLPELVHHPLQVLDPDDGVRELAEPTGPATRGRSGPPAA